MSEMIMRHGIADYLNIGTEMNPSYVLMGVGFHSLDENPSAQTDEKTYISEKSHSIAITGYQTVFPFDTDLIADDAAVMALYDIGRNQRTGGAAELEYVRCELFQSMDDGVCARKFRVAVQVDSIAGGGGEAIKVTGTLNGVGDFQDGMFDLGNLRFTSI